MTKAFAGAIVPAAVIIIGKARPIERRGFDHGPVAGEIGLAGQRIHRLGPGDARGEFHGQRVDLRVRALLGELNRAMGLQQGRSAARRL
jgi:hypothetical protein